MKKDDKTKRTFLECMFADLNDISDGTDEEVLAELQAAGIDVKKAQKSFKKTLKKCRRKRKMSRIHWYLKQLFSLMYVSTYGEEDRRYVAVWRMWFGRCWGIRRWEVVQ